jgi:type IV pilus assembly protein PilY1
MWSFDVSSDTSSDWDLAYDNNNPLFVACRSTTSPCPASDRQPITSKPALARHPTQRSAETFANIMVMFGTGQFLTSSDISDTSVQSVYGIWDRNDSNLTQSDLIEQNVRKPDGYSEIRVITDNDIAYSPGDTTDYGWFFDLPTPKERVVVNPVSYGEVLFVNTMIPESAQLCDSAGGEGWLMAVDIFNGGEPSFAAIDVNGDGLLTELDGTDTQFAIGGKVKGIPTESKFVSDKRITVDSNKNVNVHTVQGVPPGNGSRMSWTSM